MRALFIAALTPAALLMGLAVAGPAAAELVVPIDHSVRLAVSGQASLFKWRNLLSGEHPSDELQPARTSLVIGQHLLRRMSDDDRHAVSVGVRGGAVVAGEDAIRVERRHLSR